MTSGDAEHWSNIREIGPLLGMRILITAYRIGGRPLFQLCLLPVVLFYSLAHQPSRIASREYRERMRQFMPTFPAHRPWHGFRHLWNFANTLVDKLAVWMGKITRDDVTVHGGDLIDQLLSEKRGAVLLISHLGNFEVCKALSENRPQLEMTILHHSHHALKFNQLLGQQTQHSRLELKQVTSLGVADAMVLSELLSRGRFIAISADRVPVGNPSRVLIQNFLGAPAKFPSGPFILAMSLQAPVVAVQCIKIGGCYHISFERLTDGGVVHRRERDTHLATLIAAYVVNLEQHCRRAPWQWYNFYPFWASNPTEKKVTP